MLFSLSSRTPRCAGSFPFPRRARGGRRGKGKKRRKRRKKTHSPDLARTLACQETSTLALRRKPGEEREGGRKREREKEEGGRDGRLITSFPGRALSQRSLAEGGGQGEEKKKRPATKASSRLYQDPLFIELLVPERQALQEGERRKEKEGGDRPLGPR